MSAFLTALLSIILIFLLLVSIGLYLMSKMVGGFSNLKALYRLFTGKSNPKTRRNSAKSSSSRHSSRTYNNNTGGKATNNNPQTSGKMFGDNEGTYVDFEEVRQ